MKKVMFFLSLLAILLLFSACSFDIGSLLPKKEKEVPRISVAEAAEGLGITEDEVNKMLKEGFKLAPSGFMTDYSIEELLKAVENGEFSPLSEVWMADIETTEGTVSGITATFSDEPWIDKKVEKLDVTANMTPEEKAAWAELENTDWSELERSAEDMVNEMKESLGGEIEGDDTDDSGYSGENQYDVSGKWPDNEFTKLLPKPDMTVYVTAVDGNTFNATFSVSDKNKVMKYVDELKKSGFSINVDEADQNFSGVAFYSFSADNSKGNNVSITFASGYCMLYLTK